MSEYDPIIDGVRAAADDMLSRATDVALAASKKINTDEYTARDLILTMTQMVEIAATGGAEIARRAMTDTPPGLKQVADYSRSVGRRFIREARGVSLAATAKIDEGTYDVDDVVVSLTRLVDRAIVSGLEIAQTVLVGPADFDSNHVQIPVQAPPGPAGRSRQFGAVRVGRYGDALNEVPDRRVVFEPASLPPGDREFTIDIDARHLASGVYRGEVKVDGQTVKFDFALGAT